MIVLSPLQLKHYELYEIQVKPNPEVSLEEVMKRREYPSFEDVDIDAKITTHAGNNDGVTASYYIQLIVSNELKDNSKFPYSFRGVVFGQFELTLLPEMKDPERMAVINGASMLYGIIRDQFLTLTSRFVHGSLLLPTADFRSYHSSQVRDETNKQVKKKPRKKKQVTESQE